MVPVSYHVGPYVTQLFFLGHMTHTTSDRCKLYHRRYQEGNTWMGGTRLETVQGGVPPYGVKDTPVGGKW